MDSTWWPLLVLVPAGALYFYFKLTEKNLMGNWAALIKDGVASAIAFGAVGLTFFVAYPDGWLHWLGLVLALWSLTYWGSAAISYRNLRTERSGGRVEPPFGVRTPPNPARPNRRQRRSNRQKRR
ncbi:hypothetical protein [Gloeobacter morelensis]|uniref:Uncharacterized protein n=1 Tax=Gloeobacter morelensis MG652769 TaxID=2781736 RepID=A0ABY3PST4_9CYAN|nr:hypothetical protein [Gloeobacter morelensis]UFP96803.1 hypothetical protein ISF26_11585 [Gloeobacter morelensis MG652769]